MGVNWKASNGADYDWERSLSEPDLTDPFKKLNRFTIKHPHEYISVDDLKYFRRKKPPDRITKSNICLYADDETVLPFSLMKTEYGKNFRELDLSLRPHLLRRSTSLRLEGLMPHLSEHQDQYHWYSPIDRQSSRAYPIKNPENLRLTGDFSMDPEYRSSFISYPMMDRTMKILPREVFQMDSDAPQQVNPNQAKLNRSRNPDEIAALNKLAEDKLKRDVAAKDQQKCHINRYNCDTNYNTMPSEYRRQYVQFPIEKSYSIPQLSHINMKGKFAGIPEYQDSYRMYASYSKSAPIKKADNLTMSGAEMPISAPTPVNVELPEYREKFCDPPKDLHKEKPLKTNDHLHPQGEFSKVLPEYNESFRDPQVKAVPERGKCREPYLRLKGKIEFNPEYRNTYLDFPRARPIVRKPVSSFRLPMSRTTVTPPKEFEPKSPRQEDRSRDSPHQYCHDLQTPMIPTTLTGADDVTITPEYRRALTHYQLRERTPTRKVYPLESDIGGGAKAKLLPSSLAKGNRKSSDSSFDLSNSKKPVGAGGGAASSQKRRPSRHRQSSILETETKTVGAQTSFENVGLGSKKTARFGRRASVLQNAVNCREKSSIVEGNPKYAVPKGSTNRYGMENRDSFLVLNEPCKRSNWTKKPWYDS